MEDTPNSANRKRTGRWVRIALAVSLAANLLIVGLVAGTMMAGRGGDRGDRLEGRRGGEVSAIGMYGRGLSRADRIAVGKALRDGTDGGARGVRAELRELGMEAVTVLSQDPFVPEDFDDILRRQQEVLQSRSDVGRAALVAHIASMPASARAEYASRLKTALERPGR